MNAYSVLPNFGIGTHLVDPVGEHVAGGQSSVYQLARGQASSSRMLVELGREIRSGAA